MKAKLLSRKLKLCLLAVTMFVAILPAFGQETTPWSQNTSPLPEPTGFVNDYAGVIDAATKQQLETKLKDLRDTTDPSVEIAVAVVKTTGGRDIFDYSLAVARGWKIGTKADDNPSALLFVAIDDRKYFTQVSKDLEDELPDSTAGSLQRQYLVPEFKKGNYAKGISDTVDAYIAAIRNKGNVAGPQATPDPRGVGPDTGSPSTIFCCAAILLVLLVLYFAKGNRGGGNSGGRWGGGGFGGGGGGGLTSALPWIIGGMLSGGGGSSGSSSSWGGSSDSGGGGWGGFGGGGDFGGGGSGGDW